MLQTPRKAIIFCDYKILFQQLQWNYIGWVDYNLVLDSTGGPSHYNIHSPAPIILSKDEKSFKKTPYYYALGHFSKFIIPGSVRLHLDTPFQWNVVTLAFLRPDNVKVVIIYNG